MDIISPNIEAMNLDKYPPDYCVFSAKKCPDKKPTSRDYFTNRFSKGKKKL